MITSVAGAKHAACQDVAWNPSVQVISTVGAVCFALDLFCRVAFSG
jgi:hypothetical protein